MIDANVPQKCEETENSILKQLINNLVRIRRDKGIAYPEIERSIGIPAARMKELETGKRAISIDELEKLLDYYGVSYDQAMHYKKLKPSHKAALISLAGLVLILGLYGIFSVFPLQGSSFGGPGETAQAGNGSGIAAEEEDAAGNEGEDGAAPADAAANEEETGPADAASSEVGTGSAIAGATGNEEGSGSATGSSAAAEPGKPEEADRVESVVFRFWGNLPYHAENIPAAARSDARVIDIFPIQELDAAPRPDWLQKRNKDQFILNAGTAEIWTPTTMEAYQSLKDDGFQITGLGKLPEVYEPIVLEVNGKKVGFLSLAGLIRKAEQVAEKSRPGLPRAYRKDEVVQAVQEAKAKSDYLFVLIDWGKRWNRQPNTAQKTIARIIIEAGGDLVIGNRPIHAQDMVSIGGKPVFYALGHSVSAEAEENAYNFILEAEFSTQLDNISAIFGKMADGAITFDLNEEDKARLQEKFGDREQWPEGVEMVW